MMLFTALYKITKYLTAMLSTAVLLGACSMINQDKTIINIHGIDKDYPVFLMEIDTGAVIPIDSLMKPHDNQAVFSLDIDTQGIYVIQNKDTEIEFIVLPKDTINLSITDKKTLEDSDSLNVSFIQFFNFIQTMENKADSLAYHFINSQATDSFSIVREKVTDSFDILLQEANLTAKSYLRQNPSSIGIFRALNSVIKQSPVFNYPIDYEWFYLTDSLLQQYHSGHPYSIWLHNKLEYYRRLFGDINSQSRLLNEDFLINKITLPGINNKLMNVDPLPGGLTLLYLWDNNVESRVANRRIKLISEKYVDENFRIYTIAFYPDVKRWSTVIALDKLWGMNMIDTTGQSSKILSDLNNPPLPSYILINQNYRVINHSKNILQFEEWLSRYFNKGETNNQLN